MNKGFYFSMDAVMALVLMSASMIMVLQISGSNLDFRSSSESYQSLDNLGQDAMKLASFEKVNSLDQAYLDSVEGDLENDTLNSSVIDAASLLWARGNESAAKDLVEEYFSSKIPEEYDFQVSFIESGQEYVIYNTSTLSGDASLVTTSSALVSGHKINRTSSGYRARTVLSEVTKNATETTYFGGFVGQGTIYNNVTLENLEEVVQVDLEGDFSGEFDLFFNNQFAGHYEPEPGNLTAATYDVCSRSNNESICSNLTEGYNLVEINFTGDNQSVRGGILEIDYLTDYSLSPSAGNYSVEKKKIPGIDGIINHYTSFYVPGGLNSLSADMHYKVDNRTFFVKIGNATVYENTSEGEVSTKISNSTIYSELKDENLSYDYLEEKNVPLRVGIRNLDRIYGRAIADSVAVIDDSGSMGNENKLEKAKNASKDFVDIVLNASGNRAGIVGYDDTVTQTEPLTDDQEALDNTIESLVADGGTCIACGILEANDFLEGKEYVTLVEKKSELQYNDSFSSEPPLKQGYNWTELNYNSTDWNSSSAIFGAGTPVETSINASNPVFFRKKFEYDTEFEENLSVAVRTDYAASVWVNGNLVFNESGDSDAEYWNTVSGTRKFGQVVSKHEDSFERSELGENWTVTSGTEGSELYIGTDCGAHDGSKALVLTGGGPKVETNFSSTYKKTVEVSYWMKHGDSGSCETPDDSDGDDVFFEYLDSSGSWKEVYRHEAGGNNPAPGEWQLFNFSVPEKEYHSGLKFRFRYPPAAGTSYDYWAVDQFEVWKANTSEVPGVKNSWLNDGENVVSAKLRDEGPENETISIDTPSEWNEGSFFDTTESSGNLILNSSGFEDGFDDSSLGSGWTFTDQDPAGGTDYSESGGVLDVTSNGADTWKNDDEYASVFRQGVSGDWNSSVTVESLSGTHPWEKSGIMVKNDMTASGSSQGYVFMTVTDGNGYSLQWDTDGDGYLDDSITVGSRDLPAKIALERSGSDFTGYYKGSSDSSWTEVGTVSPAGLDSSVDLGLSHTSHKSGELGTTTFDDFNLGVSQYTQEGYYTESFDIGQEVNFTESRVSSNTPSGTSFDVNYSTDGDSYSDVSDLPSTDSLTVNISLSTDDTSQTPEIDVFELDYKATVAEFDMQINATEKRKNSMVVLSDGKPSDGADGGIEDTGNCPIPGVDSFSGSEAATIEAAYRANQQSGTTVYTIGFGDGVNETLMNMTARCGGGEYYFADLNELETVFGNISNNILNASFVAQTVETDSEGALGRLYEDSFLNINYTRQRDLQFDKIDVQLSSERFGGNVTSPKNGSFDVPDGSEIISARLTSYSSDKWTDRAEIKVNDSYQTFYNLSKYGEDYQTIGDPFVLQMPPQLLNNDTNKVRMDTALNPSEPRGGSPDNRFYYTVKVPNSVGYGEIFPNSTAAREDARERLKERLTLQGDEPVVKLNSSEFEYDSNILGDEPYLWGPANMQLVIWR